MLLLRMFVNHERSAAGAAEKTKSGRKVKMLRIIASVAIALLVLLQPASAQRDRDRRPDVGESDREVLLGEKSVGFRVDRDTINIGQSEDWYRNRSFRALRFHADRNDVHMMALRIVYLNGHAQDLRVDRRIRAGGDLRVDLRGDRSYLKQIEMTYRSRPNFEGQAVVRVFGEPARRRDDRRRG